MVHDQRWYIPRPRSVPHSSPPPLLRLRFLNLPLILFEDTNKNVCLLPSLSCREGCSLRTRFSSKDKPQSSGHAPSSFQGVTATLPSTPSSLPPLRAILSTEPTHRSPRTHPSPPAHWFPTNPPVPTDPPIPTGPLVPHWPIGPHGPTRPHRPIGSPLTHWSPPAHPSPRTHPSPQTHPSSRTHQSPPAHPFTSGPSLHKWPIASQ